MAQAPPANEMLRRVQRYWDAHPISTDSVDHERGSRESFEAIYRRWKASGTSKRQEFLDSCRDTKVLEVGCGIAIDGRFLSENGIDYQAVDLSLTSLKLATEHFRQNGLRRRFVNASATDLPFADSTFESVFSIGCLHHVPDTPRACREVARVLRPGGNLRVMLYHSRSYHYFLICYVVRPLIWLLLHLPFADRLARLGPAKLRSMYQISRDHGFSKKRLLDISTDTSEAGENNYNPHSSFYDEQGLRKLFPDFEDFRFWRTTLKYYPFPFGRDWVCRKYGFFLHMTARRRSSSGQRG